MTTEGELLEPREIRKLAGASKTDEQEAFLKQEGIPHKRRGRRILLSAASELLQHSDKRITEKHYGGVRRLKPTG